MLCGRARDDPISRAVGPLLQPPGGTPRRFVQALLRPRVGKERLVSDQTATISTPFPAPAKPAPTPAAARTKQLLEGPIFATLLKLAAPNVLNLLAFTGMV